MTQQCSQTEASAGYGQGKLSVLWRMRKHAEHWGRIGRKHATGKVQPIACYRYVRLRDVIGNSPTAGLFRRWLICLLCAVTLAEVWGSCKCLLWGRATRAGEQRTGQRIQVETSPALFMAMAMAMLSYALFLYTLMFLMLMKQTINREAIEAGRKFHGVNNPNPAQWLERCWWGTNLVGLAGMFSWNLMGWCWGTQVGALDDQEVRMYAKFFELCDDFLPCLGLYGCRDALFGSLRWWMEKPWHIATRRYNPILWLIGFLPTKVEHIAANVKHMLKLLKYPSQSVEFTLKFFERYIVMK